MECEKDRNKTNKYSHIDIHTALGLEFQGLMSTQGEPERLRDYFSKEGIKIVSDFFFFLLQCFIEALAKVRFLKLVKIGQDFHVKCYNFTVLFLI